MIFFGLNLGFIFVCKENGMYCLWIEFFCCFVYFFFSYINVFVKLIWCVLVSYNWFLLIVLVESLVLYCKVKCMLRNFKFCDFLWVMVIKFNSLCVRYYFCFIIVWRDLKVFFGFIYWVLLLYCKLLFLLFFSLIL